MATQALDMPRLRRQYIDEIVPSLVKEFRYRNAMQVPSITKIVLNIGLGEAIVNGRAIDAATSDLKTIAGQAPVVIRARRSTNWSTSRCPGSATFAGWIQRRSTGTGTTPWAFASSSFFPRSTTTRSTSFVASRCAS